VTTPSYDLRLSPHTRATWILAEATLEGSSFSARSFTGPELEQVVAQLARRLLSQSQGPTDPRGSTPQRYCVVASEDPLGILLMCLAALRAQHVVVLPNNLRPATLEELRHTPFEEHSSGVVAHPVLDDRQLEHALGERAVGETPAGLRQAIGGDELAVVCFTSGSSGAPQAHRKWARQVLGEAQFLAQRWMQGSPGAVASSVPAYHLYGLLFASLAPFFARRPLLGVLGCRNGQPVVAPPLRTLIHLGQATSLVSVPAHLQTLLATEPQLLSSVERVFSSAAPLPTAVGKQLLSLVPAPELVEVWGSTETGGVAARVSDPGGLWRPFPVLTVNCDDQRQLVIHSPFAPPGAQGSYTTADHVELHEHGFVHLGRADGVLKVGGKRVALQDLERCARTHPQVSDVVCIALPTAGLRNQLLAMAVASPELTAAELRSHLALHFDEVVLPRKIRILPRLPRTLTGKLARQEVEALFVHPEGITLAPPGAHVPLEPAMFPSLQHIQQRLEQAGFVGFEPAPDSANPASVLQFEVNTRAEQVWFQGHFPGAAVLPGVVQLRTLIQHSATLMWPQLGQLLGLSKVKFKRPIIPGDRLRVRLTYAAQKNSVVFDIQWLGSSDTGSSPLSTLLPQVFNQTPPSETSSGVLLFSGST